MNLIRISERLEKITEVFGRLILVNGNTTQAASGSSKIAIPLPISPEVNKDGFIKGSCASLKKLGLGNFERGDPNYTEARDRDEDGIACEMK